MLSLPAFTGAPAINKVYNVFEREICYNKGNKSALRDVQPSEGSNLMELGHMAIIPPVKCCTKCGIEYPATTEFFYRHPTAKYGLTPRCKLCRNAEEKARRPQSREIARILYHTKPEKFQEAQRKRRSEKGDVINAQRRANHDPDKARERNAVWYRNNKQLHNIINHKREARKKELPSTFTHSDWLFALEYFHSCCAVCGRQLNDLFGNHKAAMDHWIPLNSPLCIGTVATNIVPLCHGRGGCNNSKKEFMPDQWLLKRHGKRKSKQILNRIEGYFEKVANK